MKVFTRILVTSAMFILAASFCMPGFGAGLQVGKRYNLKYLPLAPFQVNIGGEITEDSGSHKYWASLWPMQIEVTDPDDGSAVYQTMCIDLANRITRNQEWTAVLRQGWDPVYNPGSVNSQERWDQITGMAWSDLGWAEDPTNFNKYKGAGLQAAIWEVASETSGAFNINDGTFRMTAAYERPAYVYVTSSVKQEASNWLGMVNSPYANSQSVLWFDADPGNGQDSLTGFVIAVPEFPAGLLSAFGIGLTGIIRWKARR